MRQERNSFDSLVFCKYLVKIDDVTLLCSTFADFSFSLLIDYDTHEESGIK